MNTPVIIYVLGLPASGKSILAKKLSLELNIPCLSKDELKVMLLDTYGWTNREGSMQAGRASYNIIDYMTEGQIRTGNSIIIESTPPKLAGRTYREWQKKYGFRLIQVYCEAEANVILERFKARLLTDNRHVSAVEGKEGLDNLEALIAQGFSPIDAEGEIIRIDTTNFSSVNEPQLVLRLQELLSKEVS